MQDTAKPVDNEDIIVWGDVFDTWCYRYELHEMTHMSDDYRVIPFDDGEDSEHSKFLAQFE